MKRTFIAAAFAAGISVAAFGTATAAPIPALVGLDAPAGDAFVQKADFLGHLFGHHDHHEPTYGHVGHYGHGGGYGGGYGYAPPRPHYVAPKPYYRPKVYHGGGGYGHSGYGHSGHGGGYGHGGGGYGGGYGHGYGGY